LAYLDVVSQSEAFEWFLTGRLEAALTTLDLLIFVPIVTPDEISVPARRPSCDVI
jgi:hypothetical protein